MAKPIRSPVRFWRWIYRVVCVAAGIAVAFSLASGDLRTAGMALAVALSILAYERGWLGAWRR